MGTRSLTHVIETFKDSDNKNKRINRKLLTIYRQMDGYPSGMGADIAEFLKDGTVVNGFGVGEKSKIFNGAGCLAAQLVKELKSGVGGIYIMSTDTKECGQEYEYELIVDFDTKKITIKCFEFGYMVGDNYVNKRKLLYSGDLKGFNTFIKTSE